MNCVACGLSYNKQKIVLLIGMYVNKRYKQKVLCMSKTNRVL